jgi:glucose/arabinose dehydrogenase
MPGVADVGAIMGLMPTHPSTRLLTILLTLTAMACSPLSQEEATPATPATTPSASSVPSEPAPSPPPSASPAAEAPATGDLRAVSVALTPVIDLDAPTALAIRPGDDALYIAERGGRVVRVVDGEVTGDPVLDISAQTTSDSERGLLGLAFSADGQHLYVSFTNQAGDSQVDEYALQDAMARRDSRRNLLLVGQPYSNHNGGNVVTGPDGMLYVGLGDGGAGGDPQGNGQDRSTLLGGLLRIDPSPSGDQPYTVPQDNPYADGGGRGELWAFGLRNPWRFTFDRATDDLWIGDVGQGAIEEIDRIPFDRAAGANFGWNVFEGTQRFSDGRAPNAVPPIFEYPHDGRCSVTGGYVYRGDDVPDLRGSYVFGDFCDGVVRALTADRNTVTADRSLDVTVPALVSFGEDADGELYALSLEGTVFRITAG